MVAIQSTALLVEFKEEQKQIIITDKRIGKVWKHSPFSETFLIKKVEVANDTSIVFEMEEKFEFQLTITLEQESELKYSIHANTDAVMDELSFPPAILPPDKEHYILQTDSEGLLLPVDDCQYPLEQQPLFRCSGGPAMAWIGMTDYKLRSGYMSIFETPYDTDVRLMKENNLTQFHVVWKSSLEKFSYDRTIRFVFFDKGGYVAQCKRYRAYAWEKNHVKSLREKTERFPDIQKLLGAPQVFVWDDARCREFLKELKSSGIERAMVMWNPNHLPYPDEEFTPAAKELGYAIGGYELFTDTHEDSPQLLERKKRIPLMLSCYPGQFDYITAKKKDGGTYSNQFGIYVCPAAVRDEMTKRIDLTLKDYAHETYFLDVYLANGLYECYDKRHPLTREGYAQKILDNMQFIEDTYGLYLGSEFGADFGLGHCVYAQGMMTLQRTWFDSKANIPGSIYYIGDWKNNSCPSIVVGSRTATEEYHKYCINEYTRVPLYELVYHDAVITTWRWEDCNHHYPEIWWKKDLFNVLYGNAPIWSFNKEGFLKYKTTFAESYQKVTSWVEQVCLDEMVEHQFVSKDRKVQKSMFSSGKAVVVNFGNEDYTYEGRIIPARDYITLG